MTINDLLTSGVTLQSVGLIANEEIGPSGKVIENVLFSGAMTWGGRKVELDLKTPVPAEWGWGDRQIRHIYPLPSGAGSKPYPILAIDVE